MFLYTTCVFCLFLHSKMILPFIAFLNCQIQKQGIGKKVMNALLKKCDEEGIKWVQLFCAKGKHEFYKKLGFNSRDSEAPGMSLFL
jgi:N-acetylglutamate synthase-like GNAT family acetyltransferase